MSRGIRILITSADISRVLQRILDSEFTISNIQYLDALSVECTVYAKTLQDVENAVKPNDCQIRQLSKIKTERFVSFCKNRLILIASIFLLLSLTMLIPTRVLFVNVYGNTVIPTKRILECAQQFGITFGASREEIRNEKIKNALISRIPELQWVGTNTIGCVANLYVEEKSIDSKNQTDRYLTNIVANQDGVIYSCVVEEGNVLCEVGQAVKKGQILVSGYTDTGLAINVSEPKAEIYALTKHNIKLAGITSCYTRTQVCDKRVKYSVCIGKKLINLFKDSRIHTPSCVRMYEEKFISLPGGFTLPVSLIKETVICYDLSEYTLHTDDLLPWLQIVADDLVLMNTVAGKILSAEYSISEEHSCCVLNGQYICIEMIGRNKAEESAFNYGKND